MVAGPAPKRLTTKEFDSLVEAGYWHPRERIELLDGQVVPMSPMGDAHIYLVALLDHRLRQIVGDSVWLFAQLPIRLPPYNEPYPDLTLLRPRPDNYRTIPEGEDVLLVIEIADSMLRRDSVTKARIYATAGIREYWIIDVKPDNVRMFSVPRDGAYTVRGTARRGETLSVGFDPSIVVKADDILG